LPQHAATALTAVEVLQVEVEVEVAEEVRRRW